jgi:hypothetical protein
MSYFGANTAAGGHQPPNTAFHHSTGTATGNNLPVAAGFGPPPTVYVLGTGTKLSMHDESPASGVEDARMRNLAVTMAAFTAPSKKEMERKVQMKRKSVRIRDGRVNLSIA